MASTMDLKKAVLTHDENRNYYCSVEASLPRRARFPLLLDAGNARPSLPSDVRCFVK